MTLAHPRSTRITVPSIVDRKRPAASGDRRPIIALTAYDYTMARLLDQTGEVDLLLVGDSAACVVQGHSTTLPITLEEMIYHSRCVVRGTEHALVVGDLPFNSYQPSLERAIEAAGRMMKEAGVAAVKLEGGVHLSKTIEALTQVDIPVVAHIGLTPQSYHRMGGHRTQGRSRAGELLGPQHLPPFGSRERILLDAEAVANAGAFAVVLEGIPHDLAAEITQLLPIPTIGIGAGPDCDGQILVSYDMLGSDPTFRPRFLKQYADLHGVVHDAVGRFAQEVRAGVFPVRDTSLVSKESKDTDPTALAGII